MADFDPTGDAFLRDAGAAFGDARERHGRVFYAERLDRWVVSAYDDVDLAMPDFRRLSHKVNAGVDVPSEVRGRVPDGFFAGSWIAMDPPEHTMPRKVAQRGFTRSRIAALEPRIVASADELIDTFAADGAVELMGRYCFALTTRTLAELLGLGREDEPTMRQAANDHIRVLNSPIDPLDEGEQTEVWNRYADAWDWLRGVVDERIARPREDIITAMATAAGEDGRPLLSRDRVVLHVIELVFAGTDTTANLMAHAVCLLDRHLDQLALVRDDPSLWPAVVEETLRRHPPVQALSRVALEDVEIGGTTIPKGGRVWLSPAGAGHDRDHYDAPERFDIRRRADDHLSFGKGRHFCMGAPLARPQARIGLERLFGRLRALRVDPGQELDFARISGAPSRRRLLVRWPT